ncbi:MAG: pyruvate formate lyase family protein, partial [Dehalobacterium sp.]
ESKRGFPSSYPDLAARVHVGSPEKFLRACAEVVKDGLGFPKFMNDEEIVSLYLAKGATPAQAYNYSCSGCTETRVIGETYVNGCSWMNSGAIVEMTLHNGRLKVLNNRQVGLPTGDPRNFKTFDEFFVAIREQYHYALKQSYIQQMIADKVKATKLAAPFCSILTQASREACLDIHNDIPNTIREIFVDMVGFATVIDSITAIKKLVYDDKKITMDELIKALDDNFKGYEAIHQMLINAPKYGNNDPYADEVGRALDKLFLDYITAHKGLNGEIVVNRLVPITSHIPSGKVIGATPDGRKAGEYLSEGCAASHGAEKSGPTAILLSNKYVKNEGFKERAARLLNIKFSPSVVAGDEGTKRLVSFIRTFCDLRLWHIQFNVINRETLIAAQKSPEKYRDLVVRVAGYSAYFTELTPTLQNELIERAEHAL